ncbi:MAG: hypothetical protein NT023_24930 [Armatimonadetes bacterium]|nr:hypothetical protein [Armatimonadota bacterium]
MPTNTAQKAYPPDAQDVTPSVKKGLSSRVKAQIRTLLVACSSLFFAWLGVMFFLYGNANIEFERNRHNIWEKQKVDATRQRDTMKNQRNKGNSTYSIEKKALDEHLSPADETKAISL